MIRGSLSPSAVPKDGGRWSGLHKQRRWSGWSWRVARVSTIEAAHQEWLSGEPQLNALTDEVGVRKPS